MSAHMHGTGENRGIQKSEPLQNPITNDLQNLNKINNTNPYDPDKVPMLQKDIHLNTGGYIHPQEPQVPPHPVETRFGTLDSPAEIKTAYDSAPKDQSGNVIVSHIDPNLSVSMEERTGGNDISNPNSYRTAPTYKELPSHLQSHPERPTLHHPK